MPIAIKGRNKIILISKRVINTIKGQILIDFLPSSFCLIPRIINIYLENIMKKIIVGINVRKVKR